MEDKTLSQTDSAYLQLEYMIIFQELKPGAMYSEKKLAEQLGLGRTPVREALQQLAFEQLVAIHPRRGIQVPEVSVESQLKLLEVRRSLESLCAELASQRATTEQKESMLRLAEQIIEDASNHDDEAFYQHLRAIHELLTDAARNEHIRAAMRPLQGLSRRFWFIYKDYDTTHPALLHADIMRHVANGDRNKARAASLKLNDYLVDFTYESLKRAL